MKDIDFLIIGAAKSATTSLQRALQADSSTCMPDHEPHYFSREYSRGDDWYLAQFAGGAEKTRYGEKSNSYMEEPAAVERIAEKLPHVRIIAQLRNPVERAYSDYCMLYRRSEVGDDIEAALDPNVAADGRFVAWGAYAQQLEPFLSRFGRERSLVLLYEEFQADPVAQIRKVRSFLDLDPDDSAATVQRRVKDRTQPIVPPGLRRALKSVKPLVAPLRGTPLFEKARGLVAREETYPALTPALRASLSEYYAPEIERLGTLIDRDLSIWKAGPGPNA